MKACLLQCHVICKQPQLTCSKKEGIHMKTHNIKIQSNGGLLNTQTGETISTLNPDELEVIDKLTLKE